MSALETASTHALMSALLDDGYRLADPLSYVDAEAVADAIRESAAGGALLWTREQVVSTIPRCDRVLREHLRR